ncbi:hypothetical protein KL938_004071 [Ogataea parapolymorpha]|nr:hypothetical protein KL938_004071 [Ogataea parapolymorpha]
MSSGPQILRIKRKRTDDPLQALLVENRGSKRSKSANYVFKLARTDETNNDVDGSKILERDESSTGRKVFSIPKKDDEIDPQLMEMLQDYLRTSDVKEEHHKPPKRRMSNASAEVERPPIPVQEDDDYVYDVYYRDKAVTEQWEKDKIGYIQFDEDDMETIDEQEEAAEQTDDEDSNDENFYRNDYPEDEDGGYEDSEFGTPSDDQDDEFDILHDRRRFSVQDVRETEGLTEEEVEELYNRFDESVLED